ncbi:guanine nucleotide-binding protein G(f) subunit alpha [Agrilus planipennis]|uniref:Guanine nucleotide-binding protein G(s) subunit alpha n=1 Tax=Agrilus planipennis TaxID=224129 RepID=A0A1W4XTH5_AGRPL|nr:guanine nucleotide-binding protein G(f) subunit alpha [Agrilus planipennis]
MPCSRKPSKPDEENSYEIDRYLLSERKVWQEAVKLLLLGTGESGKTTIIKQMKIIHINGFSDKEKKEQTVYIRYNLHEAIYTLVYHLDKISPPLVLANEESKPAAAFILELGPDRLDEYTNDFYDNVRILWRDEAIKRIINRSNEFQLIDSASYFLDRIDEISDPNYIPSVQDILHCRMKTVGISKIEFTVPYKGKKINFWMFDVGGQRGERRKWIQVFEGIQAILFLIAASDFDQKLREDEGTNRLAEAFEVFQTMFWSRFLEDSGKIVFLNKQDLLKTKIDNGHKVEDYFPEFKNFVLSEKLGNPNSYYDRAKFFMKNKLHSIASTKPSPETVGLLPGVHVQAERESQALYTHFTIATDTNNIKLVFNDVKDMILTKNLQAVGLI